MIAFFPKIGKRTSPPRTECWCVQCDYPLISNDCWVEGQDQWEIYKCGRCGAWTCWDFDPPAPLIYHTSLRVTGGPR